MYIIVSKNRLFIFRQIQKRLYDACLLSLRLTETIILFIDHFIRDKDGKHIVYLRDNYSIICSEIRANDDFSHINYCNIEYCSAYYYIYLNVLCVDIGIPMKSRLYDVNIDYSNKVHSYRPCTPG